MEHAPYPLKPLVPYMSIIHDRVSLELLGDAREDAGFAKRAMFTVRYGKGRWIPW